MELFKKTEIQALTRSCEHFMDFINEVAPFYKHDKAKDLPLDLIKLLPWDDFQKIHSEYISVGLNNLKQLPNLSPEDKELKTINGVFFCLADDAMHFSIHGSYYYNEIDWSANATYFFQDDSELYKQISDILISQKIDNVMREDILYLFSVFTILKILRSIQHVPDIANAGVTLGYSDGDMLVFGQFINQTFHEDIDLVEDDYIDKPSTAPEYVPKLTAARGNLWDYLRSYHLCFIQRQGLEDRFWQLGEEEAERIYAEYKNEIFVNQCPHCGNIKKTSQGKLCLRCKVSSIPNDY